MAELVRGGVNGRRGPPLPARARPARTGEPGRGGAGRGGAGHAFRALRWSPVAVKSKAGSGATQGATATTGDAPAVKT